MAGLCMDDRLAELDDDVLHEAAGEDQSGDADGDGDQRRRRARPLTEHVA